MTPRWLNDLVRLYAICFGGLTLFSVGVSLFTIAPYAFIRRHEIQAGVVIDRALGVSVFGSILLFVLGAILMGCLDKEAPTPVMLRRCWWFSAFLAIFMVGAVVPIHR